MTASTNVAGSGEGEAPGPAMTRRGAVGFDLRPCGTHAAYERHKARGEQVCEECANAERVYQRNRPDRRPGARRVARPVDGTARGLGSNYIAGPRKRANAAGSLTHPLELTEKEG